MATKVALSIFPLLSNYFISRPQSIYDKIVYLQRNGIQSQQISLNQKSDLWLHKALKVVLDQAQDELL